MSPSSGGSAKLHESDKVVTVYNINRDKRKRGGERGETIGGRRSVMDVIESLGASVVWVGLDRIVE